MKYVSTLVDRPSGLIFKIDVEKRQHAASDTYSTKYNGKFYCGS